MEAFRKSSLRAACLAITSTLGLFACAAPQSYMGIDFAASSSEINTPYIPPEIRYLAKRAQAGDKQAQLDLGIAFEEGNGVSQDLKKAKSLYAMAANNSGGPQWVYVPSAGGGTKGSAAKFNGSPLTAGLDAARERLQNVDKLINQKGDNE